VIEFGLLGEVADGGALGGPGLAGVVAVEVSMPIATISGIGFSKRSATISIAQPITE
jgi:hypothetical protein